MGGQHMNTDKIYAEQIANEYSVKKESKVVALKKLDAAVKKPAFIFSLSFGIVMALVFGVGMCLCMRVIGDNTLTSFLIGIAAGIVGIIGMSINYPIYQKILAHRRKKYAFEIIELAKQITDEEKE